MFELILVGNVRGEEYNTSSSREISMLTVLYLFSENNILTIWIPNFYNERSAVQNQLNYSWIMAQRIKNTKSSPLWSWIQECLDVISSKHLVNMCLSEKNFNFHYFRMCQTESNWLLDGCRFTVNNIEIVLYVFVH